MEISRVNFIHLVRSNQEQFQKIQLQALWQESNRRPAIPVQRSNQLIYRVQLLYVLQLYFTQFVLVTVGRNKCIKFTLEISIYNILICIVVSSIYYHLRLERLHTQILSTYIHSSR
jgi:uncharacterized membrane protein (DUF485 family)